MTNQRYCMTYNRMVDVCPNEQCPIAPCSFNEFVKQLSELFTNKGFSNKEAKRMSRQIVLANYKGEANGNSKEILKQSDTQLLESNNICINNISF